MDNPDPRVLKFLFDVGARFDLGSYDETKLPTFKDCDDGQAGDISIAIPD